MEEPRWYAPPSAEIQPDRGPSAEARDELRVSYGDFWIRAVARIIDGIVSALAAYAGGFIAGMVLVALNSQNAVQEAAQHFGWLFVSGSIGSVLAAAAAESIGGATFGKWVCGLRTLREDLSPCSFAAGIGRNAAFYIDSLFFGIVAAGAMRRSRRKQRLGDQWAHTVVAIAKTLPERSLRRSVLTGIVLSFAIRAFVQLASLVAIRLSGI